MAHIHEIIDFVVNVLIVHEDKVLLVSHKKLKKWLPVGGHIELEEDPEEALFREVKEECGLDIEISGEKPPMHSEGTKFLYSPKFLDIHRISATHRHTAIIYFATAKSNNAVLNEEEHEEIRWFSKEELENPKFHLQQSIQFYAKEALKDLSW